VQINFARREIACKIVYYGPGMSGKTTNLEVLHNKTPRENKGELTCIATEGDRTLFFDFMPLNLGNIRGMNTKFQLYTVPGQVYYNSTRKLVLRGVDGVIFVADSSPEKMDENLESLKNLEENLREYGRDVGELPIVLQYNKRDRPDAVDARVMNDKLNAAKRPWFEAVATDGTGVFDSLKALAGLVIQNLDMQASRTDESATASAGATELDSELVGARALSEGARASSEAAGASRKSRPRAAATTAASVAPMAPRRRGAGGASKAPAGRGTGPGAVRAAGSGASSRSGATGNRSGTGKSAGARGATGSAVGTGPRDRGRPSSRANTSRPTAGFTKANPGRSAPLQSDRRRGGGGLVFALGLVLALSAAGAAWFFWMS